jgi:RNA dependent RNA polymerase
MNFSAPWYLRSIFPSKVQDIVKTSTPKMGSSVNNQFIGILSHCGVPTGVFKYLLEHDLQESLGVINGYLDNPVLLRDWIAELGRVYEGRCAGLGFADTDEEAPQEPRSINYDKAGVPSSLYEVCVCLLEAGFLPKTNRFLREKMKQVLINACDKLSNKMHISVPKSATLICIADDLGILEEDEVSIRFSKPFKDEETGRRKFYITGDVLVARVSRIFF